MCTTETDKLPSYDIIIIIMMMNLLFYDDKKILKIPSEAVIRRTDNTMTKR